MNFDLSEDEEMLKALAERFVSARYGVDHRRAYLASEFGFSRENWALLADVGLIGALFEEKDGGLGIGAVGLATVFEALGRGLVVEPLIENVAIAARLFAWLADAPTRSKWLPALVSGEKRIALAHREKGARSNSDWVETTARANGGDVILSGSKSLAPGGMDAAGYIVSARTSGRAGDEEGVALYLVDARAPGLSIQPWRLVDGSVAVALSLDNVAVEASCCLGGDVRAILKVQSDAALLFSAEALGIMERLFAETLEYLRTRKQFGVTLGSFQVLQHRMAAQYAMIEQARALLNLAMMATPGNAARAIHGARAFIAEHSIPFGHEMIQMHGGMGVSDELIVGQGHKRLLWLSRWPEDADGALERYLAAG